MARTNLQSKCAHVTNVVRLPTAAPRKVHQHQNKRTRAAKAALPQFPSSRALWPFERRALARARIIDTIEQTPALLIATAIFRTLGEMDRMKVIAACAVAGLKAPLAGPQAVEWLQLFNGNYGDAVAVNKALERLRNGEWE